MIRIEFARAFRRHVDCQPMSVDAATVRAALDAYFIQWPLVRSYVLDDQGGVRKHVVVFVNDLQLLDRADLSDPVGSGDVIHIFQALSGG